MDYNYRKIINFASKNEIKKQRDTTKPGLPSPSAPKKDSDQKPKGIHSAHVRAVLAEQERRDKEKAKQRPVVSAKDAKSASEEVIVKPCNPENNEPEVDLKKLFTKNDRRVARAPDSIIPNCLELMKVREQRRKEKQKVEDEERFRKEKELQQEREKGREREAKEREAKEREAKEKETLSKQKPLRKHSDLNSSFKQKSSSAAVGGVSGGNSQFKIPKKTQPPPSMTFNDILKIAEQKLKEPEPLDLPVAKKPLEPAVKKEPNRPMTRDEKERYERVNTEEYQNWLKYGGPPPKVLPNKSSSKSKTSNALDKNGTNSSSQLDRRKFQDVQKGTKLTSNVLDKNGTNSSSQLDRRKFQDVQKGTKLDKIKVTDHSQNSSQSQSSDRRLTNEPGRSGDKNKSINRGHSVDRHQQNNKPSSSSGSTVNKVSGIPRKSASVTGMKNDQKLSSNLINRKLLSQKTLHTKNVSAEKSSEVCNSNVSINKSQDTGLSSKSNANDRNSKLNNSSSSSASKKRMPGDRLSNIIEQCKELQKSGLLSEDVLKLLRQEAQKTKSMASVGGSKTSGNKSKAPESSEIRRDSEPSNSKSSKHISRVSDNRTPQSTSKITPVAKVRDNSAMKKDDKKIEKPTMTAWERIHMENKKFRPDPKQETLLKRKLQDYHGDSEDEEDDEDEDEEDDDMDSFIDDGEEGGGRNDYSMYIRRLMNYDPTRYNDADSDDRCMETNYAQLLKEEAISAREGRREDLEDMMMEEEENRRKMLKKKTAKRARLG